MEQALNMSLDDIIRIEQTRLLNFIKSKVSSVEESEDILQEVFYQAAKGVNVLQTVDNVIGWLYKVANNKVIDWYRKKKIKTVSIEENIESLSIFEIIDSYGLQSEEIDNFIIEVIIESIDKLPSKQKEVITKQAIEGVSFRELSEMTGDSINTLLARKRYAVNFLRKQLKEIDDLHLYDFGVYLELEPEEEEKAMLEQNIQMALQQNQIFLEDAIDIREIKNVKLANQLLKLRRKKKQQRDQQIAQQNIQAQAQANAQAQQVAAQAEVQKQQALNESKIQLENAKSQMEMQRLQMEKEMKKELMALEFNFNMQLTQAKTAVEKSNISEREDRKDERTKIQASQQSELIEQRKNNTPPKKFESAGNDILSGDFGLGAFEPK